MNRLSLALRSGSLISKQITHKLSDGEDGRCAVGAIGLITGNDFYPNTTYFTDKRNSLQIENLFKLFPQLDTKYLSPTSKYKLCLISIIVYLNDNKGWSREKIADWIDTLYSDLPTYKVNEDIKESKEHAIY